MPRHDDEALGTRGTAAWLRRWWRALAAELAGTALLVWVGIAAALPPGGGAAPLTHPALAFGGVVVALAAACGPASGAHMNPAVTLAALLAGRLPPAAGAAYAAAQLAGATLGFGALLATLPAAAAAAPAGCTAPAPAVGAAAAAALEAALTGVLALACCAAWAERRPDCTVPLKLGLVIAGLIYSGGAATGASLNPARSFAPALLHGYWDHHWVYWAGPLGGAALAALLHRFVLLPREAAPARAEALPLADAAKP